MSDLRQARTRVLGLLIASGVVLCSEARPLLAQPSGQAAAPIGVAPAASPTVGELRSLHVQGRVYLLSGAGANITVQVGDEAVIVVNSGRAQMSDAVLAAIRQLSPQPIQYIINTSSDPDAVGGNATLSALASPTLGSAASQARPASWHN